METTNPQTELDFAQMVLALAKPGSDILKSLTSKKCHELHMGFALGGEVGELQDAIKKHIIYDRPANIINIVEELGDMEFYMQGIRESYGISRQETLEANQKKLAVRYSEKKFSNEAATTRADKLPPELGRPISTITRENCPDVTNPDGI